MEKFIKSFKCYLHITIFIRSTKLSSFVMKIRTLESLIFPPTHHSKIQQKLSQLLIIFILIYMHNNPYIPQIYSNQYVIILQQLMSHLTIKRRRTQSLKSKLHSQQSKVLAPRQSVGRILNDSLSKRRATTHNSPDHGQNMQLMEAELEQAKQLYKNKNTKSALIMFKKLYKKYPKNIEIPYFVGSCLLNQGNFELALGYFKICLTFETNVNRNVYIYMAICYKAQNKNKEAIEILSTACDKFPRFKDAYFYKGKIHLKQQQFNDAINSFRRSLKIEPTDQLAKLFLADSLRNIGHYDEAIQKYDSLIRESQKYSSKALVKKIYVLIESKRIKQASIQLKKAALNNTESIQLTFLKGMCEYQLGNYSEASTFLQLSLVSNIAEPHLGKALKLLLQIKIKEKDFLGAEHLISRSKFANTKQDQMLLYYKLVEGINDLIKRRLNECEQKLGEVYKNSSKQSTDQQKFLYETSTSFYAFCQFSLEKYDNALQIYKKCKSKKDPIKKIQQYNLLVCEGIVLHKKSQYFLAQQKFKLASKLISNKVEPIFLICVNYVQQNRQNFDKQQIKKKVFDRLDKQFRMVEKIEAPNPLFLFYQSLTLLFQGRDACATIQKAIDCSEQQISEYFFIQGLAYSNSGQTLKGLESINKAIQLDHNIPQFYKERSKYYYVLERYDEAVSDISGILSESEDQQAKLLMTFYYYMTSQYALALDILREVSQQCAQDKFKQFQMALNFRLHNYEKCGIIGTILASIIKKQQLPDLTIEQIMQKHINCRQIYSEFNVYFFHLLLSAYYFYRNDYDTCLEHLFGTLEQIQLITQNQQYQSAVSQLMINQIKYNITLTSLMKEQKNLESGQTRNYSDTAKYIDMFMNETQDLVFIKVMNQILELMTSQDQPKKSKQNTKVIDIYSDIPKVSDDLPQITITSNKALSIKAKFLILYPHKLKFNICPEFDQSFLFNFDVDKIQSKLCPPWFKLHEGHVIFTDQIRNQSVLISETDKAPTPSLLSPSPHPQNLRQKFKLDEEVQKKLQRIIKIKKSSSKNIPKN